MTTLIKPALKPRKLPVQARSAASVEAILDATIQVLLRDGTERLTTTAVARRAGVSVGTLYQYFPNKSSLLQAVLRRHLERVYGSVVDACERAKGQSLRTIGEELLAGFLKAKFEHIDTSISLYRISDDVEGAAIVQQLGRQSIAAIATMLRNSSEGLMSDPDTAATLLLGIMAGISRRMLESDNPNAARLSLEGELRVAVVAYLEARKAP